MESRSVQIAHFGRDLAPEEQAMLTLFLEQNRAQILKDIHGT